MTEAMMRRVLVAAAGLFGALAAITSVIVLFEPVVLLSDSMAPGMRRGDLVLTDRVSAAAIEVGDVVVRSGGGATPVTHRVIQVQPQGDRVVLITKGDANLDPDPAPFTAAGDLRRARRSLPLLGYPVLLLGSQAWRLLLVLMPAVLLVSTRHRAPVPSPA